MRLIRLLIIVFVMGLYRTHVNAEPVVTMPLSYLSTTSASVTNMSTTLATAGLYTRVLYICTLPSSTANIWLNPSGGTAVVGGGLPIYAGGKCLDFGSLSLPMPTTAITAITDGSSSQTVTLAGG